MTTNRGTMDHSDFRTYCAQVDQARQAKQNAADEIAADLPEAQVREMSAIYRAQVKSLDIRSRNRAFPTVTEIADEACIRAVSRALHARVSYFDDQIRAQREALPATAAQLSYISDLLAQRDRNGVEGGFMTVHNTATLTMGEASAYISSLKGDY